MHTVALATYLGLMLRVSMATVLKSDFREMEFPPEKKKPLGKSTDSLPGSIEKVEVMRRRYLLGQGLFHPGDADGICPEAANGRHTTAAEWRDANEEEHELILHPI